MLPMWDWLETFAEPLLELLFSIGEWRDRRAARRDRRDRFDGE